MNKFSKASIYFYLINSIMNILFKYNLNLTIESLQITNVSHANKL